jgi:hypothetical protein
VLLEEDDEEDESEGFGVIAGEEVEEENARFKMNG